MDLNSNSISQIPPNTAWRSINDTEEIPWEYKNNESLDISGSFLSDLSENENDQKIGQKKGLKDLADEIIESINDLSSN